MDIVKYDTDHGEVTLSKEIVRKYLVSGGGSVTDQEIVIFLALCKYQQLNPFLREAYLIKYGEGQPATTVVGKDTFTKRAAKNEKYDGAEAGVIVVDMENEIIERQGTLVLPQETLVGGWAKGWRKDWEKPVYISVNLEEYIGKKKDGTPNKAWKKMPATMIRKVPLVQMLRELFPEKFQGLYDAAEINVNPEMLTEQIIKEPKAIEKPKGVENAPKGIKTVTTEIKIEDGKTEKQDKKSNETDGSAGTAIPDSEKRKRGRPAKDTGTETAEKELPAKDSEAIKKEILKLAGQCASGLKIMKHNRFLADQQVLEYEREINDYVKKGDVESLRGVYKDLKDLYFNSSKEAVSK